jgi:superfamily II DNA or RNA helicase
MRTRPTRELTLADRLSHLTPAAALLLLGPDARRLLAAGGNVELREEDVALGAAAYVVRTGDAEVRLVADPASRLGLAIRCSRCAGGCVHQGTALSFLLEEKTTLGLAVPPPDRLPPELLTEAQLVERELAERAERAREERMTVRAAGTGGPWTDYAVHNAASGKTYRVALRGRERGDSYCSCPDFRKNALGTCKHLLRVLAYAERRFPAAALARPYRRREPSLSVRHDGAPELWLNLPARLPAPVAKLLQPLAGRPIAQFTRLVRALDAAAAAGRPVRVHPDAEEFLAQRLLHQRLARVVARIRADPARHPLRRELLAIELLPYQLDGIAFAAGAGRAILADDMGLGKTFQAIGLAELLAREAGIQRVLVVCPASVKSQWRSEIERCCRRPAQIVAGSASQRAAGYGGDAFFTICNYEQVLRDLLAIERVPWDLIVLDEAQRIKNLEAKTSRVLKGLRSRFALALTGTPLENRLEELYSVVEFVDDLRLGSLHRFQHRHRVAGADGRFAGYTNLADLRRRLAPILLRRTRAEVLRQLPPRTTEVVRIPPTDEQLGLHIAQMQSIAAILHKPFLTEVDLLRLRRCLLLARMAADSTYLVDRRRPGWSTKLERLDELLRALLREPARKIVLFSEWTTMLDEIERLLARRKVPFLRLDGSVPQGRRARIVGEFQRDASIRLLLMTNAGATGLNLQAADTVVNVDLPWNPAVLEQRIGRVHRMGQRRPVQVYLLITEGTIEENLLATLDRKQELALAALDPDSTIDQFLIEAGGEELKRRLEHLLGSRPDAPVDRTQQADVGSQLERLRRSLAASVVARDDGQLELRIALPDATAIEELLQLVARAAQRVPDRRPGTAAAGRAG